MLHGVRRDEGERVSEVLARSAEAVNERGDGCGRKPQSIEQW